MDKKDKKNKYFPPVVAVLGHVDHGKTTLLDEIRKTSIAERESGGITQKIGASSVEIEHEGSKRRITFIDTPGHAAFAEMRSRGAQAADIGLLIIASDDSIKPQTKESIGLLRSSGIPFIVVITKMDAPGKNPEKVKKDLSNEEVMIEGYGGDIPVIEVSAKTGKNLKELLDLILLVNDLHPKDPIPSSSLEFEGIVIESKQDARTGSLATVVVKNGTINLREDITTGDVNGRVRNLISDTGKQVKEATIGEAVEILGFESVPQVGSIVKKEADKISAKAKTAVPHQSGQKEKDSIISLILVADYQGSLDAVLASLPPKINVVLKKTGEVSESDILLAKSTSALVLSFNTKIKANISNLASNEKVLLKNYSVIYEMLDEIKDVVDGKEMSLQEQVYGLATIQASFPFDKTKVMGVKITEGRVAKGDRVRIERDDKIIGEGRIYSVRHGKDQVSKIEEGEEAGIVVTPSLDFEIGDMVICHN